MPLTSDQKRNLREILARQYPTQEAARTLVRASGLDESRIGFDIRMYITWSEIIREAELDGRLRELIETALADKPGNIALQRLLSDSTISILQGPKLDEPGGPTWKGPDSLEPFEKLTGQRSSLVPVHFLERGLAASRTVALIEIEDGGFGTGFLTAHNVLLTNWHVIKDERAARSARVHFNYQLTVSGIPTQRRTFTLAPEAGFKSSQEHDWTAVKLNPLDGNANQEFGALSLEAPGIHVGDRVNIIQHPGGAPKMIAYYHNVVVYQGKGRVQYLTDTLPGSSGAPVFDREWRLVAIHHSGGWLTEPHSSNLFYRNEGIDAELVRQGIAVVEAFQRS